MQYSKLVSDLPLPTPKQTSRFADHVADNHSWYKHLPFFPPGAGFVLFLSPNAGYGVRLSKGGYSVYDIEQGDYFEHHSRLSTKDYRKQFGIWDYWVDDNPRGIEYEEGPWIYGLADGQRELLPPDIKKECKARFTAFLMPFPPMFRLRPTQLQSECEKFLAHARQGDNSRSRRIVSGGTKISESDASRYQVLAREVQRKRDLVDDPASVFQFMQAEARVQRQLLLDLLGKIRESRAPVNRTDVESGLPADKPRGSTPPDIRLRSKQIRPHHPQPVVTLELLKGLAPDLAAG